MTENTVGRDGDKACHKYYPYVISEHREKPVKRVHYPFDGHRVVSVVIKVIHDNERYKKDKRRDEFERQRLLVDIVRPQKVYKENDDKDGDAVDLNKIL
jgi:hypothetical protein